MQWWGSVRSRCQWLHNNNREEDQGRDKKRNDGLKRRAPWKQEISLDKGKVLRSERHGVVVVEKARPMVGKRSKQNEVRKQWVESGCYIVIMTLKFMSNRSWPMVWRPQWWFGITGGEYTRVKWDEICWGVVLWLNTRLHCWLESKTKALKNKVSRGWKIVRAQSRWIEGSWSQKTYGETRVVVSSSPVSSFELFSTRHVIQSWSILAITTFFWSHWIF